MQPEAEDRTVASGGRDAQLADQAELNSIYVGGGRANGLSDIPQPHASGEARLAKFPAELRLKPPSVGGGIAG